MEHYDYDWFERATSPRQMCNGLHNGEFYTKRANEYSWDSDATAKKLKWDSYLEKMQNDDEYAIRCGFSNREVIDRKTPQLSIPDRAEMG